MWFEVIRMLAGLGVSIWLWTCMFISLVRFRGREPSPVAFAIRAEIRPLVPTLAVVDLFCTLMVVHSLGNRVMAVAVCALALFLYVKEEDDDDRWKRRRKKVTDKIKAIGHKLVVSPAQG